MSNPLPKFSESEAYARVVDRIGISAIRSRRRSDLFQKLRPIINEEGLGKQPNPLARYRFDDLVKLATKEHPEMAKEARRQILRYPSPHHYKAWMKMERISPSTQAEVRRAAKHGLATPFVQRLGKKPIPKWLLLSSTLACIYVNKPAWLHRIEELLKAGAHYPDLLKTMLGAAISSSNMPMLTFLLRHWPEGRSLPEACRVPTLTIIELLRAKDPACVSPEEMARLHYQSGNRKEALKVLAELPRKYTNHSWLWREGAETGDLDWIIACGKNPTTRTDILTEMLDRHKTANVSLVLKLLRRHEWLAILQKPTSSYMLEMAFATHSSELRELVMKHVPLKESLQTGVLRYQPEYLPEFLRQRPTNHDSDFWRALKPGLARKLVPLARKFDEESAMEILRKTGRSRACVRHVLAESTASFDIPELIRLPDCAALEILRQGRINQDFTWHAYGLKDTKQRLSTLRKLIGPKTPWADRISVDDAIPFQMRAACLLVLTGHKPKSLAPFIKEATSQALDPALAGDLAQVIKPAIASLSDTQMGSLVASGLQETAYAEVEQRAAKRPLGPSLLRALLHSSRPELFLKNRPNDFAPTSKDMLRLIELEQWDVLKSIRDGQAKWQEPFDDLFRLSDQKHWEKLVDLGFRISPSCSSRSAIEFFIDRGLFSQDQLNEAAIEAVHQRGCVSLLPKMFPAPPWIEGPVIDIYEQGKLSRRHLERAVRKGRAYSSNLASIQHTLARLQKEASTSRRACILQHADEEDRWGLLGLAAPSDALKEMNPYGFSMAGFKPILGALLHECLRTSTDPGQILKPAFNLSVALGNLTEVKKILHKRNLSSKTPLHDLGQFDLPNGGTWDIGAWRQLLLHHSGRGLRLLNLAPRIEAHLGRVPKDMDEAEEVAVKAAYARGSENMELAKLCYAYCRDEDQFEDYLKLMEDAKGEDNCPDIRLNGEDLGDPNLVFRRLQPKDPRGPLLGEITNCCQHLHGHAADCAEAGAIDPDASFYVLERRSDIIAQCFAWRTEASLVFDSWQGLSSDYSPLCRGVLTKAAEKALDLDASLKDVRLGAGGGTPALDIAKAKPCRWKRRLQGMDSSSQYLLAKRGQTSNAEPAQPLLIAA